MPVSPLGTIPANADVYIDANIFVYALLTQTAECLRFLARCGKDINGYSDVKVLHDTMHKLMCADAGANAAKLKRDPSSIKSLSKWQLLTSLLRRFPIEWIDVDIAVVDRVPSIATRHGLLCGDTLITVLMADYGVTCIASNDADFVNLGMTVYKPSDIAT